MKYILIHHVWRKISDKAEIVSILTIATDLKRHHSIMLFGLGRLFYVILLLINAVAVLSEERFLSRSMFYNDNDMCWNICFFLLRLFTNCSFFLLGSSVSNIANCPCLNQFLFLFISVGLGKSSNDASNVFGQQENTTKSKVVQLIGAVQTLLRSML